MENLERISGDMFVSPGSRYFEGLDLWKKKDFNTLYERWKKTGSNELKNRILLSQTPFVGLRAKEIHRRTRPTNLEMEDLYCAGWEGLERALQKYDLQRDNSFLTYAKSWIDATMIREIDSHGREIRIPVNTQAKISKINAYMNYIEEQKGRLPNEEELSEYLLLNPIELNNILGIMERKFKSIDTPLRTHEPNGDSFGDSIEPEKNYPTYNQINAKIEVNDLFERAKSEKCLSDKEVNVLEMKYGLNEYKSEGPMTFEEVGLRLGFTKQRAEIIESRAIKKIRSLIETLDDKWERPDID